MHQFRTTGENLAWAGRILLSSFRIRPRGIEELVVEGEAFAGTALAARLLRRREQRRQERRHKSRALPFRKLRKAHRCE
jgi:hypothetical protein